MSDRRHGASDVTINLEIHLTALQKKVSLNPICGRGACVAPLGFLHSLSTKPALPNPLVTQLWSACPCASVVVLVSTSSSVFLEGRMRGISTVSIRLLADYTTQYTSARIGLNAATLFILLYAPPGFTARRDKSIENARKLSEYVPPNYYTRQEKVTQNVFKCLRYVLPGPTILRGRSIQDIIKWSQYLLVL